MQKTDSHSIITLTQSTFCTASKGCKAAKMEIHHLHQQYYKYGLILWETLNTNLQKGATHTQMLVLALNRWWRGIEKLLAHLYLSRFGNCF